MDCLDKTTLNLGFREKYSKNIYVVYGPEHAENFRKVLSSLSSTIYEYIKFLESAERNPESYLLVTPKEIEYIYFQITSESTKVDLKYITEQLNFLDASLQEISNILHVNIGKNNVSVVGETIPEGLLEVFEKILDDLNTKIYQLEDQIKDPEVKIEQKLLVLEVLANLQNYYERLYRLLIILKNESKKIKRKGKN